MFRFFILNQISQDTKVVNANIPIIASLNIFNNFLLFSSRIAIPHAMKKAGNTVKPERLLYHIPAALIAARRNFFL